VPVTSHSPPQNFILLDTMKDEMNFNELRTNLENEYGQLYDDIRKILFSHDIIDLRPDVNDVFGEYDPEVNRILPQLKYATTEQDVFNIVLNVFSEMFTSLNPMVAKKYDSVIEEYLDLPQEIKNRIDNSSKEIWDIWSTTPTNDRCVKIR